MQWVIVNGLSTRYALAGHGTATIVMLHEIGGSLESWDAIAPALGAHYQTLRYDQRGAGLTEKVRVPFGLDELVDDLEHLLAEMQVLPPYYLLGTAMGAALALLFAARYPAWVEALVLCSPATSVNDRRRMYLQERAALAEREGMRAVHLLSLANSYPPEVINNQAMYETYKARFLAHDPTCYAFMNRALMEVDVAQALKRARCPTLVLAGEYDRVRPATEVAEFARMLPDARFEILAGGHILPVQVPGPLLASVTRFFTTLHANKITHDEAKNSTGGKKHDATKRTASSDDGASRTT
jgi:3-oxoadipate enol-lactonase